MTTNEQDNIATLGKRECSFLIASLKLIKSRANFAGAVFTDIVIHGNPPNLGFEMHFPFDQQCTSDQLTDAIKQSTSMYREAWVDPLIDDLIAYLSGSAVHDSIKEIYNQHR